MTNKEQHIVDIITSGKYDGMIGNLWESSSGKIYWTMLQGGKIVQFVAGATTRFFNGKENETYGNGARPNNIWETAEDIIKWVQKCGFLIPNKEVNDYYDECKKKK